MFHKMNAVFLLPLVWAGLVEPASAQPFIAVRGHAEIHVVPNIFPLQIDISHRGADAGKSQALVEGLLARVTESAKGLGLEGADINVNNLDINPETEYDEVSKRSVFRGNRYSRSVLLTFHRLSDLKAMLSQMPSGEEIEMQTLPFDVSSKKEIEKKLMFAAVADAKSSAEIIAAGVDAKVGRVQTLSDRPLSLNVGSYINPIDATSVESTTILTSEQIAKIPVARNITTVALLAPGKIRSDVQLTEGEVTLTSNVYVMYSLDQK